MPSRRHIQAVLYIEPRAANQDLSIAYVSLAAGRRKMRCA